MITSVNDAIKAVSQLHRDTGMSQGVYVIEECAELMKELTKKERKKGSDRHIIEEACDVLTTVAVLLDDLGVSEEEIRQSILFKCNRALDRYQNKKEI